MHRFNFVALSLAVALGSAVMGCERRSEEVPPLPTGADEHWSLFTPPETELSPDVSVHAEPAPRTRRAATMARGHGSIGFNGLPAPAPAIHVTSNNSRSNAGTLPPAPTTIPPEPVVPGAQPASHQLPPAIQPGSQQVPSGRQPAPSGAVVPTSRVIVYGTQWCKPCNDLKRELAVRNVPYTAIDVENERELATPDGAQIAGMPPAVRRSVPATRVVQPNGDLVWISGNAASSVERAYRGTPSSDRGTVASPHHAVQPLQAVWTVQTNPFAFMKRSS